MPAGHVWNSGGIPQTGQWLTNFFALSQVSGADSQTRKERHQVTQVVPTSTGTVGMAAESFGRNRQHFA